jgi:hypothetical protein
MPVETVKLSFEDQALAISTKFLFVPERSIIRDVISVLSKRNICHLICIFFLLGQLFRTQTKCDAMCKRLWLLISCVRAKYE